MSGAVARRTTEAREARLHSYATRMREFARWLNQVKALDEFDDETRTHMTGAANQLHMAANRITDG